jgi:hypothetical protein
MVVKQAEGRQHLLLDSVSDKDAAIAAGQRYLGAVT